MRLAILADVHGNLYRTSIRGGKTATQKIDKRTLPFPPKGAERPNGPEG